MKHWLPIDRELIDYLLSKGWNGAHVISVEGVPSLVLLEVDMDIYETIRRENLPDETYVQTLKRLLNEREK